MCLPNRYNHELVFGVSVKNLNKAERLMFGESMMTHAMVLTAVTEKVSLPPQVLMLAWMYLTVLAGCLCSGLIHSVHVCHNTLGCLFSLWCLSECSVL